MARIFVFTSWGGGFQEGQRKAYLEPFQEKFGIEVIEDSPPTPYSKIGAQAETGNITWHVVDIGVGGGGLAEAGQLQAFDKRIVDTRRWVPGTESPFHGGGGDIGSDVLLINTRTWPDGGAAARHRGRFLRPGEASRAVGESTPPISAGR